MGYRSSQWEGFGDSFVPSLAPPPILPFENSNNSPEKGGRVAEVWTLWKQILKPS